MVVDICSQLLVDPKVQVGSILLCLLLRCYALQDREDLVVVDDITEEEVAAVK
jgi:hypothetical protein